jgi:hypothetical protein
MPNSTKHTNHLINETSPYLLDHARNPVNWYPWGDEALQKSKAENKLIFLSIGYHACHWCHVMAHESFEDEAIASILNRDYICIKVDREERPDLDAIYMNACQIMTGAGGWPLNLWLTPNQLPVFAGTYFPKKDLHNRPSFKTVINHIAKLWREDQVGLENKSQEIIFFLNRQENISGESVEGFILEEAIAEMKKRFDSENGGFSVAPKFPSPHQLLFLMDYYKKDPDETTLLMFTTTLDHIYEGGIHDHIGGGFHRYSVDEFWLVPHFEKMLYDNALLMKAYTYGYAITNNHLYKKVAYSIRDFIAREMSDETGGFYTALDADSEGVEGKYYVYTMDEILDVLEADADGFVKDYRITETGNFEGLNIPNRLKSNNKRHIRVIEKHKEARRKLYNYREKRIKPALDYKILLGMNGLMIGALALFSRVFEDPIALQMAISAQKFISENFVIEDGFLYASFSKDQVKGTAVLDDYAFYIEGLIEIHQTTMNTDILKEAIRLTDIVENHFFDKKQGGYFLTGRQHEQLISRTKVAYDGAIPSGNSVMASNLLRLSRLSDNLKYQDSFDKILEAFADRINKGSSYFTYLLKSLIHRESGTKDLLIVVSGINELTETLKEYRDRSLGYFTWRIIDEAQEVSDKKRTNHQRTFYICEDFACKAPTHELTEKSENSDN